MLLTIFPSGLQAEAINLEARPGELLTLAIWLNSKLQPVPLCGGLGLCGRCRVRFVTPAPKPSPEDLRIFDELEISSGWRLACHHFVPASPHCLLELPKESFILKTESAFSSIKFSQNVWLGIDLGTTSIQWRAENEDMVCASGTFLNPQSPTGADIISRLAFARNGDHRLAEVVKSSLATLVSDLSTKGFRTERLCVSANSAMTEILLAKDISGLCAAPYTLSYSGGEVINLILEDASYETVFPPLISPFVGGDISSGILYCQEQNLPRPLLLADLGTNAEIALLADKLYVASAPCGPALEGIGPTCGKPAGRNVISSFILSPSGLEPVLPAESDQHYCEGICASGYISLLALLYKLGIMNVEGHFLVPSNDTMPLVKKILACVKYNILDLPLGMALSANDVEMLLKVKAAFSLALSELLKMAGYTYQDIGCLCLAGALGSHIDFEDLALLGFIPQELVKVSRHIGNSSLEGACLLAKQPYLLHSLASLCAGAQALIMTENHSYIDQYTSAMRWGTP